MGQGQTSFEDVSTPPSTQRMRSRSMDFIFEHSTPVSPTSTKFDLLDPRSPSMDVQRTPFNELVSQAALSHSHSSPQQQEELESVEQLPPLPLKHLEEHQDSHSRQLLPSTADQECCTRSSPSSITNVHYDQITPNGLRTLPCTIMDIESPRTVNSLECEEQPVVTVGLDDASSQRSKSDDLGNEHWKNDFENHRLDGAVDCTPPVTPIVNKTGEKKRQQESKQNHQECNFNSARLTPFANRSQHEQTGRCQSRLLIVSPATKTPLHKTLQSPMPPLSSGKSIRIWDNHGCKENVSHSLNFDNVAEYLVDEHRNFGIKSARGAQQLISPSNMKKRVKLVPREHVVVTPRKYQQPQIVMFR